MSMYDIVFRDPNRNERMGMLLAVVGEPSEPLLALRLRDAWVEKVGDLPIIAVYTRNGGGNRKCYCDGEGTCTGCCGDQATEHPSYLSDADDEFDSTYRTYRFKVGNPQVTPEIIETLLEAAEDGPVDTSERWLEAIASLKAETETHS